GSGEDLARRGYMEWSCVRSKELGVGSFCGTYPLSLAPSFIKERSKGNTLPLKNKKASSFHEFARNTSDAWDIGDDEDEDFSSSFQTLNSKVAKATAAQVLENHSKLRVKPERAQSALSEMPTNCKVIKSSSEAQLSRSPGKRGSDQSVPPATNFKALVCPGDPPFSSSASNPGHLNSAVSEMLCLWLFGTPRALRPLGTGRNVIL
uniref:Uncharacterized protein n=1 Tax=Terrapene triunguis TaxID=2587831 RepID=A0A674JJ19_9SAUR